MTDRSVGARRLPNLDGLRAFSVLLVLLFHSQFLGVTGGYIGVSVFFTISGYLLTDRLISRPLHRQAVLDYWNGRFRRILPAAWTVLLLIVAFEWIDDRIPLDPTRRLFMHAVGLANWFQLDLGGSYAALFQQSDAMVHYWSLAIEQQVYLVLPLVLWGTTTLRRGRLQLPVVMLLLSVSFALPFLTGMSVARTYYGTDTRAGEILIGVALALAHHRGIVARRMTPRVGAVVAGAALTGLVTVAFTVGPADDIVRRGLLPLVAVLSAVLIHAAVSVRGLLGGVFEMSAARFFGELSFPIYLLHWPIIVALQPHDIAPWLTFALAVGGSVALGWPLTRLVERPLRRSAARGPWREWVVTVALAITGVGLVLQPEPATAFLSDLERDGAQLTVPTTAAPTGSPTTTLPVDLTPPKVLVFGDSVAMSVGLAAAYQLPGDDIDMAAGSTVLGCGVVPEFDPDRCGAVFSDWDTALASTEVDLAILISCQWEIVERSVAGAGDQVIGQPEIDALISDGFDAAVQRLLAGGARRVALVLCPRLSQVVGVPPDPWYVESRQPERVRRLNEIITDVASRHPDDVSLVDLASWMEPYIDDATVRPDGSHFRYDTPTVFTDEFLTIFGPAIEATRADMREQRPDSTSTTTGTSADPRQAGTVGVFGDAHALAVAIGLDRFGEGIDYRGGSTSLSCGLVVAAPTDPCSGVLGEWQHFLASRPVDTAVVLSCQWELLPVTVAGSTSRPVGTAEADAVITTAVRAATDTLLDSGVETVVWMTCPEFQAGLDPNLSPESEESRQPARVAALNRIIRTLPSTYPGRVALLDLHAWMQPRVDDATLRPDGAHFSTDAPNDLTREFATLLAAALSTVPAH